MLRWELLYRFALDYHLRRAVLDSKLFLRKEKYGVMTAGPDLLEAGRSQTVLLRNREELVTSSAGLRMDQREAPPAP